MVQRLEAGIFTLGSELDADIILSDHGIEAVHLIVELDRQGLRLEPLQGAIAVEGEGIDLEPGGERHLSLPASFSIGDVRVRITAPKDAVQSRKRQRIAIAAASFVLLGIVGFQIAGPSWLDTTNGGPVSASMQKQETSPSDIGGTPTPSTGDDAPGDDASGDDASGDMNVAPENDDVAVAIPAVTYDQAAAALRERLVEEDLTDIDVKIGDGRLTARGHAVPERMDDWQDIRIWFDGAFGQDILLMANVEAAEEETPPDLAIEAVWSGDEPYLIAGGQRFFEGASVGDGWAIERIGADEITFKRDGKSFSLTL